ncbi:hypothetical protein E2320_002351 [Naja naja]|nr:hypothetical protein E2320_002351 [Naja naja]
MMQLWKEKHLESDVTEQKLMDQRPFIILNEVFTDVVIQHLEILAKKKTTNNDEEAEETAPTPE